MKQDYLWDKQGSDAEVERLEGLLSGFRYVDETEAPSNVVEFPVRTNGNRNSPWMMAMAACVAIGAIAIGAWTLSSNVDTPHIADVPVIAVDTAPLAAPVPATVAPPTTPAYPVADNANVRPTRIRYNTQKAAAPRRRPQKAVLDSAITKDEQQAYNQLMLALSITSSKLQIVRDSVNGTQESEVNNK